VIWLCRCACSGKEIEVPSYNLVSGHTQSCGCLKRELAAIRAKALWINQRGSANSNSKHGYTSGIGASPTYISWCGMIARCTNPKHEHWNHYGGAGVKVDPRWLGAHGFDNFLTDMGERPEGVTLGRFGDDGNYEHGNCEWQTGKDQRAEQKVKRQLAFLAE
jgi:hypothetical protein